MMNYLNSCILYGSFQIQDVDSKDWTHGAVVSMVMDENEREFDRCPMYFNDGADPWTVEENYHRVFNFDNIGAGTSLKASISIFVTAIALLMAR